MPGTRLGAGNTVVGQTDIVPDLMKISRFKDKINTNELTKEQF